MSNSLPAGITIRPAVRGDDRAIRALVSREHLNPMGLDWRNFFVAEDAGTGLAGIGAVKTHGDGSRELSSVATAPAWRARGVAGAVVRAILAREKGPLFLTCRDSMTAFYERFGFRVIERGDMPPYFRRLHGVFSIVTAVAGIANKLRVMRKDARS